MFKRIKSRASIVVMVVLVVLAGLVWVVARNQRNTLKSAGPVPMGWVGTLPAAKVQIVVVPAAVQPVAPVVSVVQTPAIVEVVHVDAEGASKHVAQPGETVTSMAADLLGKDTKTNRDAIINANASLKSDPDKVVVGKAYKIPAAGEAAAASAGPVAQAIIPPASPTVQPKIDEAVHTEPAPQLKYTAAPGDTVTNMAGAFLGNDDKAHQDTIVNANSSLKGDPDHVVAGQAYKIPVPNGLAESAMKPAASTLPRPTTQPDADQLVVAGQPRALRYTARSGDTVTTLAIALLGSDTLEKRNAIINNNPSLKSDPDLVVAGQSYWIPAPKVVGQNP